MANSRAWKFARLLNSDGKVKADKTELRDGAAFTGNVDFNQGADVTGDITVTGNVDGVDVSAFKSDYDGHNHDDRYYTETEADSRFVNASGDTVTGNLSVSGSLTSGSNAVFHQGYHPNADKWTTARTLSLSGDASGSVSWDGSANATLSVAVANDSHSHSNYLNRNASHESNLDTKYDADLFGWTPSTTGRPENYGQGISIVSAGNTHNNSSNWITQLGFGTAGNTAYFRTKVNSGGWGPWQTFWHNGNDGSGSGLDADLLDGVQGSSFLRSDAADTWTGKLTWGGGGGADALELTNGDIRGVNMLHINDYGEGIMFGGHDVKPHLYAPDAAWLQNQTNYGYIRFGPANTGHAHIYTDRSNFWFDKSINSTGNITAYASDKRLKENCEPLSDAVSKVKSLTGMTFNWNEKANTFCPDTFDTEERQVGVYAQDVQKVVPEAVKRAPFDLDDGKGTSKSGEDYLTVQYDRLVPLLIEAIKEQQAQIDELKAKLEV